MSLSIEDLAEGFSHRFKKNELKLLSFEEKLGKFYEFFKVTEQTAESLLAYTEKMGQTIKIVESNERDIIKVIEEVEQLKENGVESKVSTGTGGEIDYDELVKKLVVACQDIIQNEIQLALNNK